MATLAVGMSQGQMGKLGLKCLVAVSLGASVPSQLAFLSYESLAQKEWVEQEGPSTELQQQLWQARLWFPGKGGPAAFLGQLFHCGLKSKFSRLLKCYLDIKEAILWNLWTVKSYSMHIIETLLPESPKHENMKIQPQKHSRIHYRSSMLY